MRPAVVVVALLAVGLAGLFAERLLVLGLVLVGAAGADMTETVQAVLADSGVYPAGMVAKGCLVWPCGQGLI
jgi:hypothetical protein